MKTIEPQVDFSDEVLSVYNEIKTFFYSGTPKEHRKDLKKWRYHVINSYQYKSKVGTVRLISVYEENILLIENAYHLLSLSKNIPELNLHLADALAHEKNKLLLQVKGLSKAQQLTPIKFIEKFFKDSPVKEYKEILHEWLRIACSKKAAQETLTPKQIIDVYENLKGLYAALWLLYQALSQYFMQIPEQYTTN